MKTETLQVFRGSGTGGAANDKHGNVNRAPDHEIEGIFSWGSGRSTTKYTFENDRQESSRITAELYIPRTSDLKQRDRIKRSNGEWYQVIGAGAWDQLQPQTGRDFKWQVFQVIGTV